MRTHNIRFRIALLGIVIILPMACRSEQDYQETAFPQKAFTETFYAIAEGRESATGEPETKVYVDENMKVLWNKEDAITIFDHYTYNLQYQFMGEDGDNTGTFQMVPLTEFVTGNYTKYIYAVYPHKLTTEISNEEVIMVDLPQVQLYKESSFGHLANTMVAATEDALLRFRNVGSYLTFRLYGDNVAISSIVFKGNSGEKIAGRAQIVMAPGGIPETTMTKDATESIELMCAHPVTIGSDAEHATEFWFVIPPVSLTNGFTVTVIDANGGTFTKSVSSNIALERNTLKRMKPLKVESVNSSVPVPEAVDLGLSVNWASFNLGASKPEEYGDHYAWGETEPKMNYSYSTYKWGKSRAGIIKYCTRPSNGKNGFTDGKTVLESEDDAAHVALGGRWRMPTKEELDELKECARERVTINGVEGHRIIGPNGNSIFLPGAGYSTNTYIYGGKGSYVWSSSLADNNSANAWYLQLYNNNTWVDSYYIRPDGMSVRPVYDVEYTAAPTVSATPTSLDFGNVVVGNMVSKTVIVKNIGTEMLTLCLEGGSDAFTFAPSGDLSLSCGAWATITVTFLASTAVEFNSVIRILSNASNGTQSIECKGVGVNSLAPIPEAVDLGLSVKWASFNLGASKPEEYGDYYAWGELEPNKDKYDWSTYKWRGPNGLTKYCIDKGEGLNGFVDRKFVLEPEDDVAHVALGGRWRMPTKEELEELTEQCTWKRTIQNGVYCVKVTSNRNGSSIILPSAGIHWGGTPQDTEIRGYYWSSSLYLSNSYRAWYLYFYNGHYDVSVRDNGYRAEQGFSIRPVTE